MKRRIRKSCSNSKEMYQKCDAHAKGTCSAKVQGCCLFSLFIAFFDVLVPVALVAAEGPSFFSSLRPVSPVNLKKGPLGTSVWP